MVRSSSKENVPHGPSSIIYARASLRRRAYLAARPACHDAAPGRRARRNRAGALTGAVTDWEVLPRPKFREVDVAGLKRINPELVDVPLGFLEKQIRLSGSELYQIASSGVRQYKFAPNSVVPRVMPFKCAPGLSTPPSHYIAVPTNARTVVFFPVHALVFSVFCTNVAPLPVSPAYHVGPMPPVLALPVVTMMLPALLVPRLLNYLYTGAVDKLLLPVSEGAPHLDNARRTHTLVRAVHLLVVMLGVKEAAIWERIDQVYGATRAFLKSHGLAEVEGIVKDMETTSLKQAS